MELEEKWEILQELLEEKEEHDLSNEEFFGALDARGFITEKIIYQDRPYKTPPEQLEYLRARKERKRQEAKIADEEARKKAKIDYALSREKSYCFHCKSMQLIKDKTASTKLKRNQNKESIKIKCKCCVCDSDLAYFGGYL